jgi:uncharacterized membrane protein
MIKKYLNRLFIDGLSGMAFGLFSTLIIGTIICQIASIVGTATTVGAYLNAMGNFAKTITGAGIGVGVACKLKASPLTTVSAAVCGLIGAFPSIATEAFAMGKPGEPLGAFIAAYIAIEIGSLVAGKTKVDIIVTPVAVTDTNATFVIDNALDTQEMVILYCVYSKDKNVLEYVKVEPIEVAYGEDSYSAIVDDFTVTANHKVKAMLWDGVETLRPYAVIEKK